MLFNSFEFLVFFILITTLYFILPHRFRWLLLLSASCVFYMFFIPVYILILFFTIVIDYVAGIWIERSSGKKRKRFLWLSLAANIGVLSVFKYYNFINEVLTSLPGFTYIVNPIPHLDIILPIGLSFHTFQAMSYTIEVYRGHQAAEKKFGIFALYVMFYPQLVAGPIERPQNLLHQFYEKHAFEYKRVADGLRLMAWGLFKKAVIADRLSPMVDAVYNDPSASHGWGVIVATVFFSFQIYCDFSGYSDMAIGAARVMGFRLMTNFRTPYFSTSISEFWKRWHISLSTWFRDYLYIPLGGNRVAKPRWYLNLLITFMVSGLWHGANFTFLVWGALHGFYLVFAIATHRFREKLSSRIGLTHDHQLTGILNSLIVFVLVTFGWIFFRASSLHDALTLIRNTVDFRGGFNPAMVGATPLQFQLGILFIGVLLLTERLSGNFQVSEMLERLTAYKRWALYVALLLVILNFGVFGGEQFIYFQF